MPDYKTFSCPHGHDFLPPGQVSNERRTWLVIGLTALTMVVEIVSGLIFGSMALLADGWHMASHASALGITAFAYYMARRHRENPRFTFGTGKIGDLAGYTSAFLLGVIAVLMVYESIQRLVYPVAISFDEAIAVAVIGLIVNIVSAVVLGGRGGGEETGDRVSRHDPNIRAAYFHVLADALTSILAIAALTLGRIRGWSFLDPVMGIVGAVVIGRWSIGLMRNSGRVLLDINTNEDLVRRIRTALHEGEQTSIDDLHVWQLGPGQYGAVVSLRSDIGRAPDVYKERLCRIPGLAHVTIEVNP